MKQIKVVARGTGATNNDALGTNGIINVSFNEPVTIEAGSRIALDKFYCYLHIDGTNAQNLADFPDLAIEMSSLNFESYDSDKRGRRNVVSYFPVQNSFVAGGSGVSPRFIYEAKVLSYLSINNEMDIDISTIVFRVVNIKTGLPLAANYVSFNLLIN